MITERIPRGQFRPSCCGGALRVLFSWTGRASHGPQAGLAWTGGSCRGSAGSNTRLLDSGAAPNSWSKPGSAERRQRHGQGAPRAMANSRMAMVRPGPQGGRAERLPWEAGTRKPGCTECRTAGSLLASWLSGREVAGRLGTWGSGWGEGRRRG